MANKKIGSHWYTEESVRYCKGEYITKTLPDGRLFAKGEFPTKLTKDDLTEHFKELWTRGKKFVDVKNMTDVMYRPNYFVDNHLFKDDFLYVSWTGKLEQKTANDHGLTLVDNYDMLFWGWAIKDFVDAALQFTDGDMHARLAGIKKKLNDKMLWYAHMCPERYELVGTPLPFKPKVTYVLRDMSWMERPLTREEQIAALDQFCAHWLLEKQATIELEDGDARKKQLSELVKLYPELAAEEPVRPILLFCHTEYYNDEHRDTLDMDLWRAFGHNRCTIQDVFVRKEKALHSSSQNSDKS